uniref:Uncharacterized protein n=1 Tax=Arundo donax TaxID=35708 RepID=A0A0A9ADW6_ARUDO
MFDMMMMVISLLASRFCLVSSSLGND